MGVASGKYSQANYHYLLIYIFKSLVNDIAIKCYNRFTVYIGSFHYACFIYVYI